MPDDFFTPIKSSPFKPAKPDYLKDLSSDMEARSHGPIPGRMKDGVRVITYSLTPDFNLVDHKHVLQDMRLIRNERVINAIENSFKDIEAVANVKFVQVTGSQADIRFFEGKNLPKYAPGRNSGADGYLAALQKSGGDVVIRKNASRDYEFEKGNPGYGLVLHEIMHAMGFSHPGANGRGGEAGGYNFSYNMDGTIMSYNIGSSIVQSLGPYDIAALQYYYGKPKQAGKSEFDIKYLTDNNTLYSETPATINLRKFSWKGDLSIDLSSTTLNQQINGHLDDGRSFYRQNNNLAFGTQIKDVLTDKNTRLNLYLKGNELPNRLEGGAESDRIEAVGGNDILTGRGGADIFVFSKESKFGNVITDFTPKEDKIAIPTDCVKLELRQHEKCAADGNNEHGTQIIFYNKSGEALADVFAINTKSEDFPRDRFVRVSTLEITQSRVLEPEEANPNQHLPALPVQRGLRKHFK